ncbi:MAG: DIP1984 family protein [Oscillospiraceae bacterium]
MKLAEALSERADLQKRISQLNNRLLNNSKVQEGEKPVENPIELLSELDNCISKLEYLIKSINYTNCVTIIDGISIADLIAKKDTLTKKVTITRNFLNSASEIVNRYSNKEIKIYSTVNVAELQKNLDLLSKELRELNVKIQGANWTTDLIEK